MKVPKADKAVENFPLQALGLLQRPSGHTPLDVAVFSAMQALLFALLHFNWGSCSEDGNLET